MRRARKDTRFNSKGEKGPHFGKKGANSGKKRPTNLKVTEPAELMKFLQEQMPDKSRNTIKSILAHRQVSIDYKTITQYNHPLKPGQLVVVNWEMVQEASKYQGLKIVFEDPYIIVIEKNSGLLSVSTEKERIKTAYGILTRHIRNENPKNRIFVVHRLDREVSGLMVFAKNPEVQQQLMDESGQPAIEQRFVAVVEGAVEKDEDTITSWLWESKAYKMHSTDVKDDGLKAVTHYQVQRRDNNFSLVKVIPETHRKNQIRVHMKEIGHCVVGDKKYDSKQNPIKRIALHAQTLAFRHPVTGQEIRYETSIPKKFSYLITKGPKG